jgi:hypothetical protein
LDDESEPSFNGQGKAIRREWIDGSDQGCRSDCGDIEVRLQSFEML